MSPDPGCCNCFPQDLTLSYMDFVGEWLPSDVLSCAGLTALRLRECYGSDYLPWPADPEGRNTKPPATRHLHMIAGRSWR